MELNMHKLFKYNAGAYVLFTIIIPFAALFFSQGLWQGDTYNHPEKAVWMLLLLPALLALCVNAMFGPSIFAYWVGKRSRRGMLVWNIIAFILAIFLTFAGHPTILAPRGLWIWALLGIKEERVYIVDSTGIHRINAPAPKGKYIGN
jgi:hypothetical protein